jgi:hypothetical protein
VRTSQDLILHAGLPPLVREGDRYAATFTVRNASQRALRVTAKANARPVGHGSTDKAVANTASVAFPAQTFDLAAGAARDIAWAAVAPVDAAKLRWDVRLAALDGKVTDRVITDQTVIAAYPVRVYQATLLQLDGATSMPIARPRGAIPGRGGVALSVQPTLADGLAGVREYMSWYPYICLEQRVSREVALRHPGGWDNVMDDLPTYLDPDGLVRYFPTDWMLGSDTLTAYVLSIAQEAGYPIPNETRARLVDALKRFVAGRLVRDSVLPTADLTLRKLAAIEALARYDAADAQMVSSLAIEPNLWPTSGVIAWLNVLSRVDGIADAAPRRAAALQVLRSRLNFQGTQMGFSTERSDALWWLMISTDTNAVRALLTVLDEGEWREDAPRMLRGALGRQRAGHWSTTTANAWGVLAVEKFSAAYEKTAVCGALELFDR